MFFFLENKLKNRPEIQKIIPNILWLLSEKFIRVALGLLTGALIARYLGPENFGILNFAAAFTAITLVWITLGLDHVIVKELVKNKKLIPEILGSAFLMRMISGVVGMMFISIILILCHFENPLIKPIIFLHSLAFVLLNIDVFDFYFQSKQKIKFVTIPRSIGFITISLIKIVFVIMKAPLIWFAVAVLIEVILYGLLIFIAYSRYQREDFFWRISLKRISALLSQSWPLMLTGVFISIYMKIDQVMLGSMIGQSAVGLYSSATRITEVWYFVPTILSASAFPSIIKAHQGNKKVYHKRMQTLYFAIIWIALAFAIPISLFSKEIITILYGKNFIAGATVLSIQVWAAFFAFIGIAKNAHIQCENLQKYFSLSVLIGALTNVILNFILIPSFNIYGAAIATVISQMVVVIVIPLFYKKDRITLIYMLKALRGYRT